MRTSIGFGVDITLKKLKKWTVNYNKKGYAKIPKFRVNKGDELTCTAIIYHSDTHDSYILFDSISPRMFMGFTVNPGSEASLYASNNVKVLLNSEAVTKVPLNSLVDIKLIFSSTHDIEFVGANYGEQGMLQGRIFNISMKSKNEERFYPSVINSRSKPNLSYLEDKLNTWRRNQYIPDLSNNTIRIPSWVANEDGDSINFKLKLNSIASKFMHLTDENVTESVPSGSRSFITFDKLAPHSLIIYPTSTRVEINGRTYASKEFIPSLNTEYQFIITYPKGIIVDFLGGRYEGDFSIFGVLWDIKMNSATDNRHYPAIIESNTKPTLLELTDVISGKNALRILNTRREKIILYSTPSHYQSLLPKTIPLWTNELSTDGELINFEDQHWVEF